VNGNVCATGVRASPRIPKLAYNSTMRWQLCAVALSVCLACCVLRGEDLPKLPALNFGDFPTEVRDQVQQAYGAARQQPRNAEAVGKLGMLLDLYDRPEQALACYQQASQLDERSFQWLYYLASLLAKQKNYAQAAQAFQRALRMDPSYLPARLKLAESLLDSGEIDESKEAYSEIVEDIPGAAEAYFGLGRIAVLQGNPAAARESFHKACELFPTFGAAHYALAQVDRKLGRTNEAEQELALYANHEAVVPPVDDPLRDQLRKLDMRAAAHLERGVQLEQVGRLKDAVAETEEALRLNPELVKAHINLLILYARVGNREKAEEHFQAAVKLNATQFPDAYYNYGVLLIMEGKLDEAEQAFRRALAISPSYAAAHNDLGNVFERHGKLAEAAAEYRKAIEGDPSFRRGHFNLGRMLINQHKYAEAIEQLLQTRTPVDAETPAYLYALGAAYGRAGDNSNALHYMEQAKELAVARGQTALASEIDNDLEKVKAGTASSSPQGR
jgi:tetratricopeptide (TPR) repeat protein